MILKEDKIWNFFLSICCLIPQIGQIEQNVTICLALFEVIGNGRNPFANINKLCERKGKFHSIRVEVFNIIHRYIAIVRYLIEC